MRLPSRGRAGKAALVASLVAVLVLTVVAVPWLLPGYGDPGSFEHAQPFVGSGECAISPTAITDGKRQLRGMTITTVGNLDWPSAKGLDEATLKEEYRGWLDLAERLNLNAVFVQIRPSGDAFWPSGYAPWSQYLTGRRDGQGPGWDPLAFMVSETHARNIEFHAWFNPYKADGSEPTGAGADISKLQPNHPLRLHPDWAVVYPVGKASSKLYFNPGVPAARGFIEDSMIEVVARYDIDSVFFDDFFYPYPANGQDFGDAAAYARYGKGFASKADWRRDNVNTMVREMGQRIKAVKPWVKFGISPFGIWRNQSSDPRGSATNGLESYSAIYVDTRRWVKENWLDYIIPQLYWHIGNAKADFAKLVPWWSDLVAGTRVQLYIAHGDYRIGEKGAWSDPAQLDRQLALNERYPVAGTVHFSAVHLRADKLGAVTRYVKDHYPQPSLVPAMAQLPKAAPTAPTVASVKRHGDGAVTLNWHGQAARYAIYRADPAGESSTLVASLPGTDHAWTDRDLASDRSYVYCVAGLDRTWNRGPASYSYLVNTT